MVALAVRRGAFVLPIRRGKTGILLARKSFHQSQSKSARLCYRNSLRTVTVAMRRLPLTAWCPYFCVESRFPLAHTNTTLKLSGLARGAGNTMRQEGAP